MLSGSIDICEERHRVLRCREENVHRVLIGGETPQFLGRRFYLVCGGETGADTRIRTLGPPLTRRTL